MTSERRGRTRHSHCAQSVEQLMSVGNPLKSWNLRNELQGKIEDEFLTLVMNKNMKIIALMMILLMASGAGSSSEQSLKASHHRSQIRRSFTFRHGGFGERMDDVRLLGNAAVMADGSIKIPMQDHVEDQAGRALFASPVRMWDPNTSSAASFDTEFSFSIGAPSSRIGVPPSGGGLAFVIVPDEISIGRGAAFMGMLNDVPSSSNLCDRQKNTQLRHPVIAVEFDTFKDEEFGDPNDNHVGINLGSVVSDTTADLADAGVYLRNASLQVVNARIVYDGSSQELRVHVSSSNSPESSMESPLLTAPIDLSGFLREYMFVGFSAATGSEARTHRIFGWKFSCASHAVQRFPVDLQPRARGCNESELEHEFEQSEKTRAPPRAFVVFLAASAVAILALLGLFILWHSRAGGGDGKATAAASTAAIEAALMIAPPLLPRPRPLHRPRRFEFAELAAATSDFDVRQRIHGGNGADDGGDGSGVYRATLQDGSMVVVKRLHSPRGAVRLWWLTARRRRQLERETFTAAMVAAAKLRHANLVPLRGWCCSLSYKRRRHCAATAMLVVYDYMPNGSLDKWLYPGEAIATLPWLHRWKVARDVAAALAYLHSRRFPHGRLKASNVILDITFRARLGDYGLAFLHNGNDDDEYAEECGSSCNMRKKYADHEQFDVAFATDVASFGVVLLELARGTPIFDLQAVLSQCRDMDMDQLVDCRLAGDYNHDQAACLLGIGMLCVQEDEPRPSMDAVIELLDRVVSPSTPVIGSQSTVPVGQ